MTEKEKRFLIVANPESSRGRVKANWPVMEKQLRAVLDELGFGSVDVSFTSENDHGSGIVRSALKNGVTHIAARFPLHLDRALQM